MSDTPYIESVEAREARIALMLSNDDAYLHYVHLCNDATERLQKIRNTPGSFGSQLLEGAESNVLYAKALLNRYIAFHTGDT